MGTKKFDVLIEKYSDKWRNFIHRTDECFITTENRLSTQNVLNVRLMLMLAVICFGLMWFFNSQTPLAADDFDYKFIFGTESTPVSSIWDIFKSMKAHYYIMNGRIVLHFFVQLFILLGKPVFNVVNSAMYILLTLLIYKHCVGKTKKNHSFALFLAINLAVWTFSPGWGQSTIWLDGSVNYMWGSVVRLAVLLPFRLYADDGKERLGFVKLPLMLVLGIIAGDTNENTGAAMIGMMVLFILYYKVKGFQIRTWTFTGLLGAVTGYLFLLLAPSNYARLDRWEISGNSFKERLINIPGNLILYFSLLLAVFVILATILYQYGGATKDYRAGIGFIYVLGSLAGVAAMLAAPCFPPRAWFGMTLALIIADGFLFFQLGIAPDIFRRIVLIGLAFWSLWCSMSCVKAARDAVSVMQAYNARVAYITQEKAAGNYDLTLPTIPIQDEHSPLYGVPDLSPEPGNWINVGKEKYYGLDSLTAQE